MKIIVEGSPQEIAALAIAVQGQHDVSHEAGPVANEIAKIAREAIDDMLDDAYQGNCLNDSVSHQKYTDYCNMKCLGNLSSKYGLGVKGKYKEIPSQEKPESLHEHPDVGGTDRRYCMDIKYIGDRIPTFKNSFEAGIWLYNYFKSITEVEFASCLNQILSAEDDHLCIVFKTQVDGFLPCDSRIAARHNSYHSKRNRNA